MLNITNRAKNVSPSLTLAITAKANKLKESGVDIVSFAAGEPDFNTPEFIVNAAKDALDKGLTKYTPASGIAPLKKAVCAKLKRDQCTRLSAGTDSDKHGRKAEPFQPPCRPCVRRGTRS